MWTDKGEVRKVCANPDCPIHHPKKQQRRADPDATTKAAQEKQRREEATAQATGLRVLKAIGDAVPVRLMKRRLAVCCVAVVRDAGRDANWLSSSGSTA